MLLFKHNLAFIF